MRDKETYLHPPLDDKLIDSVLTVPRDAQERCAVVEQVLPVLHHQHVTLWLVGILIIGWRGVDDKGAGEDVGAGGRSNVLGDFVLSLVSVEEGIESDRPIGGREEDDVVASDLPCSVVHQNLKVGVKVILKGMAFYLHFQSVPCVQVGVVQGHSPLVCFDLAHVQALIPTQTRIVATQIELAGKRKRNQSQKGHFAMFSEWKISLTFAVDPRLLFGYLTVT